MSAVCQINYNRHVTKMFMRLAAMMEDQDLCLGPPIFSQETGDIIQLCGMCPMTSGSLNIYKHIGNDEWDVSNDDCPDTGAVLQGEDIHKWFSGDW